MSYILDALRRADAEREMGAVPTLHTQAVPLAATEEEFDAPPNEPWRWASWGLGLLALGLAAWWFIGDDVSAPAAPLAATAPLAPITPEAPSPLPPPAALAVADPATVPRPPAAEPPVGVTPESPRRTAAVPPAASAALAGAPKKGSVTTTSRSEPKTPAKAIATAPGESVLPLNELPEAIRREQPKLSVGGAMHSANPANRMLILNGQVFHEGDQVTPDLVLEQIKLKSAVLVYKGQRYSINY